MKKQDFKKNYPDVCVQEVEFQYTLSRKAIEEKQNSSKEHKIIKSKEKAGGTVIFQCHPLFTCAKHQIN